MAEKFLTADEAKQLSNQSPGLQNAQVGQAIRSAASVARVKGTYDFSEHGGVKDVAIDLGEVIPAGSIVTRIVARARTAATSGGAATLTLLADDIELTEDIDFDELADEPANVVLNDSKGGVVIEEESAVQLLINVADLTDGVLDFYIELYQL